MSDVKVIVKKKEPSCWNCFTIEDGDGSDTEDKNIPAITLPKVREEHREKLKVYSFFAAELSKPTAVSLKQKVSKHCAIGKKIDEKILEQLKDSESNGLGCNGNNTPDDSNKNITQIQDTKQLTITDNNSVFDVSNSKVLDVMPNLQEDQNADTKNLRSTSKDVNNDIISNNTAQKSKLRTEFFSSMPDTNKILKDDSDCEYKLNNTTKLTELESDLEPSVIKLEELLTKPQLQKEISTDPTDSNYRTEHTKNSNVLQKVHSEEPNTKTQNAEISTFKDVINDNILDITTQSTKITMTENFASLSDTNNIILHDSECEHKLSNANKRLKRQNSILSDISTDTKSADSTDSSLSDSNVLQEVHREDQNTEIINAERLTSKDVVYVTIPENVTQSTKITKLENFSSISDTDKIIHDTDNKDELSNTNKTTDLNLALIPTVLRSEELSQVTPPQLQKEIILIAPNKSPTLKRVDTQSEIITEHENNVILKVQNCFSSDLTRDTKTIDSTDSSYRAENINDSIVLQEVHREDLNTEIINAERLTSKDVVYDTIPENVTQNTKITNPENFGSISGTNKIIHDSDNKDEFSNTNKTTDLNLALIPTVLESEDLSQVTPPQLQKEITLIAPNKSPTLKSVDMQSETKTEPENDVIIKVQNCFSSDLTMGTKSSDSTDSSYRAENINDSIVLQEVNREDQNTENINAERLTSKDVIYDTIPENVTPPSTIITKPENFDSVSNSNKVIHDSDNKDELSNTNKTTDLNLALIPTVLESEDLSQVTPPQLQKEITLILPNKSSTLKSVDTQSETITEPENDVILKVQNCFSSDLSTDTVTKSADSTDSSNCAENKKDSSVLHDVHNENSKTKIITKLPILKQNINSRYSPLYKLKRSLSTDKATVTQDCVDKVNKSSSEINPTVYGGNYQEMTPKKENLTKRSSSSSNIETKPITPLRKKKIESKNITLLPNQSINKISTKGSQVSPINKEKVGLSKTLTVTSKTLPTVTPPALKKNIPKESITSSKNPTSKTHTIIPTEKISFLKRKSSELSLDTKCNSSDIGYCSESTEDMNLSQDVHRKHSKSDIGTKLPVLKQNINSKYSPLHKLKKAFSKDKVVSKDDIADNGKSHTERSEVGHEKKSEETTLEVKDLSAINISKINIPLVTSTPKNKETDSRSSEEIYKSSETLAEPTVNHDKSQIAIPSTVFEEEKKINFDMPRNEKFSKSRSLSTEGLGKILCPSIIRRSTLSMDPRSLNFQDEMYISEESPGHATLPRRSNSPLPHERDLDRERFPHNRSGLQTRSESMASVYSGAGEGIRGGVPVRGEVQFSLVYNYRLGALEVGVKRCRDLAPIDVKKNRSDPYVKVYLLPDKSKTGKRKTKVKKNTLNPVFEETLSFQSSLESLSTRALWLSAWHADMFGRNDFLGEVTLPLAGRVFDDPAPNWYALVERSERPEEMSGARGDLIVGLKFELEPRASTGTLHVLVKEARRLVPSRPGAVADVFCKSYLLPERGRLHKQKTPVCRRTLAPSWRAPLQYPRLSAAALSERALELTLWDRDRLASNEFLGAVRLSRGTGTYRGESVSWMDSTGKEVSLWETMLQQPNFWVEGSLPLRPHLNN